MAKSARSEIRSCSLPPELSRLKEAREFIAEAAGRANFTDERIYDISVACSEAMANAIEHASGTAPIGLETRVYDDRLEVSVRGTGRFEVPDRSVKRQHRGLGLPLMAKFSDHLALYSAPQGGTLLTLTFYREGHADSHTESPLPPGLLEIFESSERLESVFETMGQGFAVFDTDWRCVYVNTAMLAHTGGTREELLSRPVSVSERSRSPLFSLLDEARATGTEVRGELEQAHNGSFMEASAFPFAGGVALFTRDITGMKQAERARETAKRRSDLLAETAARLLTSKDPQSLVEEVCAKVMKEIECDVFFNFLVEKEAGKLFLNAYAGIPALEARSIRWLDYGVAVCGCAAQQGERIVAEDIPSHPDPRTDLVKSYGVKAYACHPLIYEDEVLGTLSFGTRSRTEFADEDLAMMRTVADLVAVAMARIRTERDLRSSEDRFRSLFRGSPVGVLVVGAEKMIEAANPAAAHLLGWSEEDLLCLSPFDIFGADGRFARLLDDTRSNGQVEACELRAIDSGKRSFPVEVAAAAADTAGRCFITVRDISAHKRTEEALRESEEEYRALAKANERLYRQQRDIAEGLQLALLNIPSKIGRVRLGHLYRSATEAARVGGDFYDVFEVRDGQIVLLIGDVAGHGIQAARTATLVKDVVHAFTHQSLRPHEVLRRTNRLLVEKQLPGFVTLFLGILEPDSGQLRYASAGHPETLLRRTAGEIEALMSASLPLGIDPGASWKPFQADVAPGDLLLLYTDGIIEARRDGELFGEERLRRSLGRGRSGSAEVLPQLILDEVLAFSAGRLGDDVALLALTLAHAPRAAKPLPPFEQQRFPA